MMSCVADAVATNSAPTATMNGETEGSQSPRKTMAAISRNCDSNSQPRRRPNRRDNNGTSSASISGAHRNLMV